MMAWAAPSSDDAHVCHLPNSKGMAWCSVCCTTWVNVGTNGGMHWQHKGRPGTRGVVVTEPRRWWWR